MAEVGEAAETGEAGTADEPVGAVAGGTTGVRIWAATRAILFIEKFRLCYAVECTRSVEAGSFRILRIRGFMKYRVMGRDVSSGQPIEMTFEAAHAQEAFASAQSRGIFVEAVNPVHAEPATPPSFHQNSPKHFATMPPVPQRRKPVRLWAVVTVLVALIGGIIQPNVGYAFFCAIVLLIVLYAIPGIRVISRVALGLSVGRPAATTLKIIFVALLGGFVLWASVESETLRLAHEKVEQARWKAEVERQLAINKANNKVDSLMVDVKKRMEAGDVDGAFSILSDLREIDYATNKGAGTRLYEGIALSRDSKGVRGKLLEMSDDDFNGFASGGKVPGVFDLGYPILNNSVLALARPMVSEALAERKALAKKRAEEADARRKEELARIEAERKERERKAAAETARMFAEQAKWTKKIGDTLHVGYMSYSVWSVKWPATLSPNQFLDKRANANWLAIEITVRNDDKQARTIPPFKLVDDQGREYERSADGMLIDNAFSVLEDLNPDVSKQGVIVFDVPKDRHYRIKLSGGFWSNETGYIILDSSDN